MTAGRPLQFDPVKVQDKAMRLFWEKGYESTSMDNLLTTMNISKSSFYQAYKSKRNIFESSIRQYQAMLLNNFKERLRQAASGRDFIETLFYDVANETSGPEARRGCLLMNTANEFSQTDPEIASLVADSLDAITTIFEQAIHQAQQEGLIATRNDARTLAVYLLSCMSGLKNMVKAGADRETIKRIVKITLAILDKNLDQ